MHRTRFAVAAAAALALTCSLVVVRTATLAAEADDEAKAVATKALTAGAALFDAKNAKGLAETYTDDAVLTVVTRDQSTNQIKKDVRHGRADIEAYYQEILKPDAVFHAKNTVEHARLAGSGVVIIAGYFEPDFTAANPMKLAFVQTRVKQGDAWKITDLQVFFLPGS